MCIYVHVYVNKHVIKFLQTTGVMETTILGNKEELQYALLLLNKTKTPNELNTPCQQDSRLFTIA